MTTTTTSHADIVNPTFNNVTIDNTENPVNFAGGSFVGNYAPLAINDANRKSIVLLAAGSSPAATGLTTNPEEIVWSLDGLEGSDELR